MYSCLGIQLCVQYFLRRGHTQITAFVPQWRCRTNVPPGYEVRSAGSLLAFFGEERATQTMHESAQRVGSLRTHCHFVPLDRSGTSTFWRNSESRVTWSTPQLAAYQAKTSSVTMTSQLYNLSVVQPSTQNFLLVARNVSSWNFENIETEGTLRYFLLTSTPSSQGILFKIVLGRMAKWHHRQDLTRHEYAEKIPGLWSGWRRKQMASSCPTTTTETCGRRTWRGAKL